MKYGRSGDEPTKPIELVSRTRIDAKVDSGLLRFLGTVMSKFVKDNLSDE